MNEPTKTLHITLLRAAKMVIAAWERWLEGHETNK